MKKWTTLIFCILFSNFSFSQDGEFKTNSNGLIYSENTMEQLSKIVDSLNLFYKTCDLNKTFYGKAQAIGYHIELDKKSKQAKKDLDKNISIEDFIKKYPEAKVEKDVLIIRSEYQNYQGTDIILFSKINIEGGYDTDISFNKKLKKYKGRLKKSWVYRSYDRSEISAFYLPDGLPTKPMKKNYAQMVGYADCLIDTTSQKMKEDLKDGSYHLPKKWEKFSKSEQEELLEKMRGTRVVGFCSMDNSPRIHAINIAKLSAQTNNWEVFLKAHLDIMNDRFERASDGSYAWGNRKTYIKELEELNINVHDLIFGITLRLENPASNHYYGSIRRIGRALSETKNHDKIAKSMLTMISDSELDDYNRILIFFLYKNYNYYIEDKVVQKNNIENLKRAALSLPDYIKSKIKIEEIKD